MKRILIADDALELGRLLQTVFLTLDPSLSIQVVPSAEEALLESSRKPIDLLVSDVRLPGMSGLDLVKKIRLRNPTLRVIIMTGLTDPKVIESVRDLNVNGFFRKPVDMNVFLATARKCLDMPAESPLNIVRTAVGTPTVAPAAYPRSAQAAANQIDVTLAPLLGTPTHESVSEMVIGLRQRLGAIAVLLLDERGRVVAQAGDVPSLPFEERWTAAVMAVLSAGEKVSRLAGEGPASSVMAFPGKDYQLVLAPAGDHALLILLQPGRSALRLALAVEEALEGQQRLAESLAGAKPKPIPVEAPAVLPVVHLPQTAPLVIPAAPPGPVVGDEPELHAFEALFQKSDDPLKGQDVNAFWDELDSTAGPGEAGSSDGLTYDQARQLGLTPKEEK